MLKKKIYLKHNKELIMKYVMCPYGGRRLCQGEAGTKVEIQSSK